MSKKDELELAMQQVRGVSVVYPFLNICVFFGSVMKTTDVSGFTD